MQEVRFQVLLNWDRSKQMLTVNGALLAAAAALYKLQPGQTPRLFVGVIFALSAVCSVLGVLGVRSGQTYYRAARDVKARYEQALGLPARRLALETTLGMARAHRPPESHAMADPATGRRWKERLTSLLEAGGKLKVHLQFLFAVAALLSTSAALSLFFW